MKNQYLKLEFIKESNYSKELAVKHCKQLYAIRKSTAQYVNTLKKLGLNEHCSIRSSVINSRHIMKRELSKPSGFYVVSRLNEEKVMISEEIRLYNRQEKNVLKSIRLQIKERREANKDCDYLNRRKPNYILMKYQNKLLSTYKIPKDLAQYLGIEIECIFPADTNMQTLVPFAKWINLAEDGSIQHNGDEMSKEIRVCIKREELYIVIPSLMKVLHDLGASVNKSCGLHVHLDQRNNEKPELTFQKLVRSLGLLYTIVPKSRRENTYCKRNSHSRFMAARDGNRYRAVNACAYNRYQTIEVRLFGGTLNADKIINWVETLLAISDGEMVNRCPKNFDTAKMYWKLSDANIAWLKARQIQFASLNAIAPTSESDTEEAQELLEEREGELTNV